MKYLKGLYVASVWIYAIASVGYLAILPPLFILEYLTDTFPFYDNLVNVQAESFIGAIVGFIMMLIFFLIPFFILYIPSIFILLAPIIWLNEKVNIKTGLER